jgi:hypothetical protein
MWAENLSHALLYEMIILAPSSLFYTISDNTQILLKFSSQEVFYDQRHFCNQKNYRKWQETVLTKEVMQYKWKHYS